jgi:cytochrome c-type biogenesis protein CcmH/NrfG
VHKPVKRTTRTPRKRGTSPKKSSRLSFAFIVVSSLVVFSMLVAGLVTAASLDLLGGSSNNDDSGGDVNYGESADDVISAQQTVVAGNPDDVEALMLLANLLGNSDRLNEAIPLYEQATQMRPDDASIRLDFARALADGGKPADAEVQFLKALAIEPESQAANYYLAELYRMWTPTRSAEAIPLYQRAVQIDGGTFIAELAQNQLVALGAASPVASPPGTTPAGTPGSPG